MRLVPTLLAAITLLALPAAVPASAPPEARLPPQDKARQAQCRDTVAQARELRGLERLPERPARAEEPLLIAAVDHRIGGCSAMVMHRNTADVRPLPSLPEGPARLMPAR